MKDYEASRAKDASDRTTANVHERQLQLAVFDIDGTLRTARDPWIHLHNHLGFLIEAKKHHDQFHSGEIDYKDWVDNDAALWRGIHRVEILRALDSNPLRQGTAELISWFHKRNIPIVGISTGLNVFNDLVAEQFGFRAMHSNELLFDASGVCTGRARINVREDGKGSVLDAVLAQLAIQGDCAVAFGDGSADIQLFERVGLSFAVHSQRKKVRNAATHCIDNPRIDSAIKHLEEHVGPTLVKKD